MKLVSLSQVSHLLYPGVTLAWSVRDANGTLLLAKGHVLADERAVQTLLDRGMFIDAAEIAGSVASPPMMARAGIGSGGQRLPSISACPCLLYTSPSPRDGLLSRMPSSA